MDSITGSLGNSVANSTGLNVPATIPSAAGLPGGTLQIPTATATIPTIDTIGAPSECLLLKNMFDPKDEVVRLYLYYEFLLL